MLCFIDRRPILPRPRQILLAGASIGIGLLASGCHRGAAASSADPAAVESGTAAAAKALDLSAEQRNAVKIEPVGTFGFVAESDTVGTVSFD